VTFKINAKSLFLAHHSPETLLLISTKFKTDDKSTFDGACNNGGQQ